MAKLRPAITGMFLLLSLLGLAFPAVASPDEVKWSRFNIPLDGQPGNWVLADSSDIQHLTMARDGTLYAYGKGLTYTLYKSTDNGHSWSSIGKVLDAIVDLAIAPDNIVYYATSSAIYKSTEDGSKFIPLPSAGGAGSNGVEITSFDVTRLNNNIIVAGTRDTDNAQYGGVYILDEIAPFTWKDTNIGSYDVYAVAFSPSFPGDRQIVAVVTDETNTFARTKFGDSAWGSTVANARLNKDNSGIPTPVAVANSAAIVFPEDYAPQTIARYFVAIDAGGNNGDVYKINNSVATDLNIGANDNLSNIDVTGLAITGNVASARLLAGAASSAEVYFSPDGGRNWTKSTEPPTGQGNTYVVMASDFVSSGRAYAATSGTESAFSLTMDAGTTWNQVSLIDTDITDIIDLAPSPDYSQDNTLFMLTFGGKHSLWRSQNGGAGWERILSSTLAYVDQIDRVGLPPQYSRTSPVVFIAGTSNGKPVIWKSKDNGQTFNSSQATPLPIDVWAIVNDTTLFIGSFDGSNGLVYCTTDSGLTYSTGTTAGNQSLNSIAISPNYKKDGTILVGNTNGWVYWSNDNGSSFGPLPPDATSPPLTGLVTVTFDPEYSSNNTAYAASSTAGKGIYRFTIGKRTAWENIDGTLPAGGIVSQMIVSSEGTLYAANSKAGGGMERCLDPTYPLGPTSETVTRGLDDGAKLTGLWLVNNMLWSIDAATSRLMNYTDSLALPVTQTSPPNKAPGIGTIINYKISNVSLDWKTLSSATEYKWQLNYNTNFSNIPAGFEGNTQASSAQLPVLEPNTTYYWRVRATQPVLSPWSEKWSFITSAGTEANAPALSSPEAGARDMPIKPIFQWSAIAGANGYELIVSTDAFFGNPSILKTGTYALPTTAWQCNTTLNYDTTYYWRVRAVSNGSYSAWSAAGAFTTEPAPKPQSPPPPAPAPLTPQSNTPDWMQQLTPWLMPLGGVFLLIFLLIMMMMLITMIVLTIKILKL